MQLVRVLPLIAVLLIAWRPMAAGEERSHPTLTLVGGSHSGKPILRVWLENDTYPCRPFWMTLRMSRPGSVPELPTHLSLTVQDADGHDACPVATAESVQRDFSVEDALLLDCGLIAGRRIDLTHALSEWRYDLGPGTYRVRACLASEFATFLSQREELKRRFLETRADSRLSQSAIRDFATCSEWGELTVTK